MYEQNCEYNLFMEVKDKRIITQCPLFVVEASYKFNKKCFR